MRPQAGTSDERKPFGFDDFSIDLRVGNEIRQKINIIYCVFLYKCMCEYRVLFNRRKTIYVVAW